MGPDRRRIWLPLTRLGFFFASVVVVGNVIFHAFRPEPAEAVPGPVQTFDFVDEKKRQFDRILKLFFGASVPAKSKVGSQPVEIGETIALVSTDLDRAALPPIAVPAAARLGYVEPEPAVFVWPAPLKPTAPELPLSMSLAEAAQFRASLVTDLYRREKTAPGAFLGNILLAAPELLLDEVFACTNGMAPRCESRPWDEDEGRSLSAQLLEFPSEPRSERIYADMLRYLSEGERRYFANFEESRAGTIRPDPHSDIQAYHEFMGDQRKLFWEALRRAYFSRYKGRPDDRLRDDVGTFDRWQGADFVVMPPLLAGYLYYRGFDKTLTLGEMRLHLAMEPLASWTSRKRDLPVGAGVEWSMNGLPFSVMVTAGLRDGKAVCDFAGIGTSLGAVRKALSLQTAGERPQ